MGRLGTSQLGTAQLGGGGTLPVDKEVWRIIYDGDQLESDLYDVEVVDTANPFGNYAIAYIDDFTGSKFDIYSRGTQVEFQVSTDGGINYSTRFIGFVVESRELDQQGADALEVECFSFDQFLRKDTVSNDQSGKTISTALQDIINTDTPVDFVASNVTVEDDLTLETSYRGDKVENVLQELRGKSANERFGVNNDLEFFFQPQETNTAPRDIDNTQWFDYDIPEEGKRAVNEVTVYFDSGNESVTVDDGSDKLALQDSIGTNDPISFATEVSRPDVTTVDAARDIGKNILNNRATTLTGTVTTFGLESAEPGEVLGVTITERGIDTDFQIAELKYRWGRGTTTLTIVEKRGDQADLLVNLSDTLKRVELANVNRDAISNVVTNTNVAATIATSGDVDGTQYDQARFTVDGLNKLRQGWGGDGNISVAEIAVGNDGTNPTRSDTSLGNELERVSVSETLPDSKSVEYTGDVTTTDIREVGLFATDGSLLARATIDPTSLSSPVTVTLNLTVANDTTVDQGVVTDDGQTAVRDVIADNSPDLPIEYQYGDGDASLSESDDTLDQFLTKQTFEDISVQTRSPDGYDSIVDNASFDSTDPFDVGTGSTDKLKLAQTNFVFEAENNDTGSTDDVSLSSGSGYSDNGIARFNSLNFVGQEFGFLFTPQYEIPAGNVEVQFRLEYRSNDFEIYIDNTATGDSNLLGEITTDGPDNTQWLNATADGGSGYTGDNLQPGTQYEVRFEATNDEGGLRHLFDVVSVYDNRFTYDFDNTTDSNDYLSGPELYPVVTQYIEFDNVETRRDITGGRLFTDWNDTSGDQAIGISNDGGANWLTNNNNNVIDKDFASPSRQIKARLRLARFGSRTTATPTEGFKGQEVDDFALDADLDSITAVNVGVANVEIIIPINTINGETIREAGQFGTNNLLTRVRVADIDVEVDQRVYSAEQIAFRNA